MQLVELLRLPAYRNVRVLAGKRGLSRQVKSVNMMDAPDIIHFLKPNELLLTTAYAIREKPEELLKLVRQMADSGCAGLGIKTKRFLQKIPDSVFELADALDFPLIELALEPSLGELLQASLSCIMEKHNEELNYAIALHRDFSRMIMQGKGIASVIDSLSRVVEGTVLLMNHRYEAIFSSKPLAEPVYEQLRKQTQAMMSGLHGADDQTVSSCFFSANEDERAEVFFYRIQLPRMTFFLILVDARIDGSPLPRLAIEQAANVIGFELMKQQAVKERSRRFKNEFFENLVEGRFASAEEMLHLGKRYGLHELFPCHLIVGKTDDAAGEAEDSLFNKRDDIYESLKSALSGHGLQYAIFNKKELFVLLVKRKSGLHPDGVPLPRLLADFQEKLYRSEQISLSFGIGNPVEQPTHLPNAFKEALNALRLGYQSKQTRFVQIYRAKEVVELLQMIPGEARRDFYKETFRGLADIDAGEREELLNTARVFLETQCQIAETAKQMFIHRNTVAYRMAKFEKLTGRSLRDPNDSLRFRLAFLLEELQ
ncbi:PucR family transcriptional regulator [Cohnella laeviribosi]|uniref:PucR family transcriptional regulator n=1 Tax=Cohnella laeviribosi TaxID=380174 RepID=UPI003D258B58